METTFPRRIDSVALMSMFGAYASVYVLIPLIGLVVTSLLTPAADGFIDLPISLHAWQSIFAAAHISAFLESFVFALLVTGMGLVFAISVGYIYYNWRPLRPLLLSLIGAALLTNPLVITMGWLSVLSAGTVPQIFFIPSHLLESIRAVLYTDNAVVLGLLSIYVPITTFPLLLAIHNLDPALPLSAALLGAKRDRIYLTIVLPGARPEIIFGALATLVYAVSDIVVPDVLGGNKRLLIGRLISLTALEGRNLSLAAALVMVLLFVLAVILFVALRRNSTSDD